MSGFSGLDDDVLRRHEQLINVSDHEDVARRLRELAVDHAAYDIAHGLSKIVGRANPLSAEEGADQLRDGLSKALTLLLRSAHEEPRP